MEEFDKKGMRVRVDYSKLPKTLRKLGIKVPELPNLIEVQKTSYNNFLQRDVDPKSRELKGLHSVFKEVFPIKSIKGNITLDYDRYTIGEPKYSDIECKERGMTFGAPLKFWVKISITDPENEKKPPVIKEPKEPIYVCEIPIMTEKGTFIINGAERVIINQLHRSPGVFFDEQEDKMAMPLGKLFSAKIVPYRGSWLEFESDANEVLYARIDKKRKFYATLILKALGSSKHTKSGKAGEEEEVVTNTDIIRLLYQTIKVGTKDKDKLVGSVLAQDVTLDAPEKDTLYAGHKIDDQMFKKIHNSKHEKIEIVDPDEIRNGLSIFPTLLKDSATTREGALVEIYRKMRPGQPVTKDVARSFFDGMFFVPKRYDLGKVGRYKLNKKLDVTMDRLAHHGLEKRTLTEEDIIRSIKYLLDLTNDKGEKDDIDHFGNRRVRAVGELVENQVRIGLVRMERNIKEKMNMVDVDIVMPTELVNTKPILAALREFFGTSQLSQFMDQTNPLAELTHKRRLSALGPGGLDRDRAGFEVRDVHYTHYGRMCPIETPEGPNIGLISSLPSFAKINEYGFIETPYRLVEKGMITSKVKFLTADEEDIQGEGDKRKDKIHIAQATTPIDDHSGKFKENLISARIRDDFRLVEANMIDFIDVSPMQMVSVSAALVPFLEHDDANRALMGSNMQRQAVALIKAEAPIVGTGIEGKVAYDSEVMKAAKNAGTVEYVDAQRIEISNEAGKIDVYELLKNKRSNQDTCVNQKPIVRRGQKIAEGQVIADGPCTDKGELALGQNVLVALMPWRGYNFEDAIIISENLLKEDKFTSIHIEEFSIDARDTKLGEEEITRDIPNVSEEALKNLDETGIVRIGAEVNPGDILVGKVTPKGEAESTPEEKLLRAIFGEKAKDVKNASLKVPPGISGIVVDIKMFARKESMTKSKENEIKKKKRKEYEKLREDIDSVKKLEISVLKKNIKDKRELEDKIEVEEKKAKTRIAELEKKLEGEIVNIEEGDTLSAGVIKMVKIYIAKKRKLAVGDKMAGRHGNKGVIAKVVPVEDMPYMPDGTPVDIILNPLGVPSRMNVGQILEAHLGWACKVMGFYAATPVFDGAKEDEIRQNLKDAGLPENGKSPLIDGITGMPFDEQVLVGYMYMLKLSHLVDDKVHARSTGPYSLITQQPLGGKAQFGGQRFGEMEVWALEAYGASHTLQEMLTIKSDDVAGRTAVYEAIVKGKNTPDPGLPESFNVLIRELQGLGLDVNLIKQSEQKKLKKEKREKPVEKAAEPEKVAAAPKKKSKKK